MRPNDYLRPYRVIYPGWEIVTTAYNSMGLPQSLTAGSDTLVSGAS